MPTYSSDSAIYSTTYLPTYSASDSAIYLPTYSVNDSDTYSATRLLLIQLGIRLLILQPFLPLIFHILDEIVRYQTIHRADFSNSRLNDPIPDPFGLPTQK